ncbi:MAG: ComF family protein [Lachnospiraceae bacterium]|nr:ComF family protein [Lachnospiraceae bacterium]
MSLLSQVTDILYPRRCPVCDDVVAGPGLLVCEDCKDCFTPIEDPYCMKCGKPMQDETVLLCGECMKRPHEFTRGRAAFVYDDVLKESVYRFKYGNRPEYAKMYASAMAERLDTYAKSVKADALVPIPLHKSRLRERGYNQAELLADRLSEHLGIPVRKDILARVGKTRVQKSLGASQRENNLKKAFKIASDVVKLNNIILVDDIFTTGSTMDAAAACLKEAGVAEVYFLVLGMADIG